MKSKKDFFIVDVSIQKIEDKLYKVVLYRDKPGEFPHREEYKCPI